MALSDLLNMSAGRRKVGLSEERLKPIIPVLRQYIAYWREYPDMFVDFLQTGGDPTREKRLKFFFYQRVFLRVSMRYKYVYAVYPRAYSKSFLAVLVLMIQCILYPGAKLFSTAGGKEQSASILKEKTQEICDMVPAFNREIDRRRASDASKESKDHVIYVFKNKSRYDNVAAKESSRGKRRHRGLIEECVGVDGDILKQVLIPIMNVSRNCANGERSPQDEPLNQGQLYITTAGYKNTYAYDKLIQVLVQMVAEPKKAYIMGGTWRVPAAAGLIPRTVIQDLKNEGTYDDATFSREYESKWVGSAEDAFFNAEVFDRNRILQKPEYEASGRSSRTAYYIISVDVGRHSCQTVACIFKVTPQGQGPSIKTLVNIVTYEDMHFEDQAIQLKKLFYKYRAKRIVIDGNGIGDGLIDYMVKSQIDPISGDQLPDFGVYNDEKANYKKYRTNITEFDAVYIMKANPSINTTAYTQVQVQMAAGKIKFLIEDRVAQNKLLGTTRGKNMTPEERSNYLHPYRLTSILKEELLNLRQDNDGVNIILKQANKGISKDKVSALCYGIYYIREEEDSKRHKHKKFNAADWAFFN